MYMYDVCTDILHTHTLEFCVIFPPLLIGGRSSVDKSSHPFCSSVRLTSS